MAAFKTVDLQFYIEDDWISADIDQSQSFAFNLQATDLQNPTTTKVPYSVAIKLPKTQHNDHIFDLLGKYDHHILTFNPIKRVEFRLIVNGNVYQDGYMKLEKVSLTQYEVRLFGGLGDFFYTMSEVGDERDMRLKSLDFGTMFNHTINRNFIRNCWNGSGLTATYYDYSRKETVRNYEIMSYAMTYQGKYDNFDSDSIMQADGETIEATWEPVRGKTYSSPDLNEHRRTQTDFWGEFRSYYQKPMVRVNTIYNKIIETMTKEGWQIKLDETFFNQYNPYWEDLWMICPQYDTTSSNASNDYALTEQRSPVWNFNGSGSGSVDLSFPSDIGLQAGEGKFHITGKIDFQIYAIRHGSSLKYLQQKRGALTITPVLLINGQRITKTGENNQNNVWLSQNGGGTSFSATSANTGGKRPQDMNGGPNYYYDYTPGGTESNSKSTSGSTYQFTFAATVDTTNLGANPTFKIRFEVSGDTWWRRYKHGDKNRNMAAQLVFKNTSTVNVASEKGAGLRSEAGVTFSDIITSETTAFDFFISYGKMFGFYYVKDVASKTISVLTRNSFFALQQKVDWTDKIDYSKEHSIEPVPFDYKVGVFKWDPLGTKYEDDYLSKTSKEYGSARFNTLYEFSNDEKDYLDGNIFGNCVIATDYSQYYLGRDGVIYKDNKVLPYLMDNASEKVDINFVLVFKGTPVSLSKNFIITDDSDAMLSSGYCWQGDRARTVYSNKAPNLTRVATKSTEQYSLNFGRPSIAYNELESELAWGNTTDGYETLYARFWRRWLRDRFSQENKFLTCYVALSVSDIASDLFRKFIYIQNTIWVLDKIHQFNPLSKAPTKVTLVKVQETDAYVAQSYIAGNLILIYNGNTIYDASGGEDGSTPSANPVIIRTNENRQTITLAVNSSLSWRIGEVAEAVTVTPVSGGSGITTLRITIPENDTGGPVNNNIPIIWGNTTTIVQIIQVSKWSVDSSTNAGTATANGATGTIQVNDSDSVVFSTTADSSWIFGYWMINGERYTTKDVTLTITDNTTANAVWFNASEYVKMTTNDTHTRVTGVDRYDDYWLLREGASYDFVNTEENLSGYLFDSDDTFTDPASPTSRTIARTDTTLQVFYDTLLAHISATNLSDSAFDLSQVVISSPTGAIPSPTGSVPSGGTYAGRYSYPTTEYGDYVFDTAQQPGIYVTIAPEVIDYQPRVGITTVKLLIETLKWGQNNMAASGSGETITNRLYLPNGFSFEIDSDVDGIAFIPASGTDTQDISIVVPENDASAERTITVTASIYDGETFIREETFTITQAARPAPELELDPPQKEVAGDAAQTYEVELKSNAAWEIVVPADFDAYADVSPLTGTGDATITVTVSQNDTSSERIGYFDAKTTTGTDGVEKRHTVTQTA